MPVQVKPLTYFLRPHYVYFALGAIVVIHIIASLTNAPAFIQLIINSVACVYIGCMANSKIKVNKDQNKLEKVALSVEDEAMTKKDAAMFPIYLSGYLFGLYLLFKVFDKQILQALLTGFFSLMGVLCLMTIIGDSTERFFTPEFGQHYIINHKIKFFKTFDVQLTRLNILAFTLTLFPISWYLLTKNWLCNNLFGAAFSISGIQNFNVIPSFKVGMLMLWGLFFYDIFWVYGTDVMLTVAKSIDAPIKLMFPYNWQEEPPKFSMLGLGDIVIPGVFVALSLKYDVDRQISKAKKFSDIHTSYFNWCFAGYAIGMITTFIVMVVFDHPQPALLFLVPGCTISVILKAFKDGKMKELLEYENEDLKKPEAIKEQQKQQ